MANDEVKIDLGVDLTKARQQIDRFVADVERRKATIPASAGGDAGGGVGAAPTAAGVLGASTSFRVGGQSFTPDPSHPWSRIIAEARGATTTADTGGGGRGGRAAVSAEDVLGRAQVRLAAAQATGPAEVANVYRAAAANAPAGSALQVGYLTQAARADAMLRRHDEKQSRRLFGLSDNGLARYVGIGFLANEATRLGTGFQDYQSAMLSAGSNARMGYEAELGWQETIGGVPVVGHAAGLFANPIANARGFGAGGTKAIMDQADVQAKLDAFSRGNSRRTLGYADRDDIMSTPGSFARAYRGRQAVTRGHLREIQDRVREWGDLDEQAVKLEESRLAHDFDKDVTAKFREYNGAFERPVVEEVVTALNARRISGMRSARGKVRDRQRDEWQSAERRDEARDLLEMWRDESYRRSAAVGDYANRFREAGAAMIGSPFDQVEAGQRTGNFRAWSDLKGRQIRGDVGPGEFFAGVGALAANALAQTMESGRARWLQNRDVANSRQWASDDTQASIGMSKLMLAGNPFAAQLADLDAARDRALRGVTDKGRVAEITEDFRLRGAVAQRGFDLHNRLRDRGLAGEGSQLDAYLKGGAYGSVAANAIGIRSAAMLSVEALEAENGGGANRAAMILTLQNAEKSEELLKKQFFSQFRATEISPNRTDTSGGGPAGGFGEVVQAIGEQTRALLDKLNQIVLTAQ